MSVIEKASWHNYGVIGFFIKNLIALTAMVSLVITAVNMRGAGFNTFYFSGYFLATFMLMLTIPALLAAPLAGVQSLLFKKRFRPVFDPLLFIFWVLIAASALYWNYQTFGL